MSAETKQAAKETQTNLEQAKPYLERAEKSAQKTGDKQLIERVQKVSKETGDISEGIKKRLTEK